MFQMEILFIWQMLIACNPFFLINQTFVLGRCGSVTCYKLDNGERFSVPRVVFTQNILNFV